MILPFLAALAVGSSRLQVGTSWGGEETIRYVNSSEQIDQTDRWKLRFRITGKDEKLWTVERKINLLEMKIGDEIARSKDNEDPAVTKEWLAPDGSLVDLDPFDSGTIRLERLLHFWLPANFPDRWIVQLGRSPTHFLSPAEASFGLLTKTNTTRTYALTFAEKDNPVATSAIGRMTFDVQSGRLLRARIEAKRALVPGGTDTADVTLAYEDANTTKPLD
jgi:hypothetical protein